MSKISARQIFLCFVFCFLFHWAHSEPAIVYLMDITPKSKKRLNCGQGKWYIYPWIASNANTHWSFYIKIVYRTHTLKKLTKIWFFCANSWKSSIKIDMHQSKLFFHLLSKNNYCAWRIIEVTMTINILFNAIQV